MRALLDDLRHALRMFATSPGFVVVTSVTLALGIGANTAVFSVIDAVLLRPLPYADPDRIVVINETPEKGRAERWEMSYPNFADVRTQARAFDALAAYRADSLILTGAGEPARVSAARATPELFPLLGAAPSVGRAFGSDDDRPGAAPV